ncbi:MAG: hypothetical protein HY301_15920 [Verrucomicrobia bacterium]|nr:hypothetical protein [Verrucomicrobiota bacterium]
MDNPSPPSPIPSGSPPPAVAAGDGHVAAYEKRGDAWNESVLVRDFFHQQPDLAAYLPAATAPASRPWAQIVFNLVVLLVLVLVVVLGQWRFKELFRSAEPVRTIAFTTKPQPLARGDTPASVQAAVGQINDALAKDNWLGALEIAQKLAMPGEPREALRAKPAAWRWLVELLVSTPVLVGDRAEGGEQQRYYQRGHDNFVRYARSTGTNFTLLYHKIVADFHVLGGVHRDTTLATADDERARTEELLHDVSELRNRFSPELARQTDTVKRLALIEGWALAWRLGERGASKVLSRFDKDVPANQARWRRLAELINTAERDLALASDRDLLRLKLWFWEAAESFCFNPLNFDEEVVIGSWTSHELAIKATVRQIRQQLNPIQ